MLNGAKTVMDVCFIKKTFHIIIDIDINFHININIYKTHIHHCFGTIEHFLVPMDMILRPVGSAFNFLSDFLGFKMFL